MRKISTLLMMLCLFVGGSWAQVISSIGSNIADLSSLEEGDQVVLKNVGRGKYLLDDNSGNVKHGTAVKVGAGLGYIWQVHLEDDKLSFSSANGKYISTPIDGGDVALVDVTEENKDEFVVTKHHEDDSKWLLQSTNNPDIYWDGQDARFVGWQGNGTNSRFEIIPVETIESVVKITDVAELKNNKLYHITPAEAARGSLYATSSSVKLDACGGTMGGAANRNIPVNLCSVDQQFAFYVADGKIYLYSVGADKFVSEVSGARFPLVENPGKAIAVEKIGDYFAIKVNGTECVNVSTGYEVGCVGGWNNIDNGNKFEILEVADMSAEVATKLNEAFSGNYEITYNFYDGETKVGSQTIAVIKGNEYPSPTAIPAYVQVSGLPTGVVPSSGSYDLQCTLSDAFPFKGNFGMTTRGGAKWFAVNKGAQELTTKALSIENLSESGKYTWTIGGSWYNGFDFKHVESAKYLAAPSSAPDNGSELVLQDEEGELTKFDVVLNNGNYYLKLHGTENSYVSDFGGGTNAKLKFWNSASNLGDGGSIVAVEDVDAEVLLAAFKAGYANLNGVVGSYKATADEINALTVATVGDFIQNTEKVALVPGYYFIKGTGNGNNASWYITYGTNNADFQASSLAEGQKLGAKHVWSFDPIVGEDGYKLKSCNLGKYAQTVAAAGTSQVTSDYETGYKFTFTEQGEGKFIIKDGNNNVLRTEGDGRLNYWGGENNETWYLIPATELEVDITEAGYATLHLPFGVELPAENLTAYAVSSAAEGIATLKEKSSVPANEGVILKGEKGTYTLTIADVAAWNAEDNLLEGTNVNTYVAGEAYVLGADGEGAGFFKAALNKNEAGETGSTHFLNNANKAYLPASAVTTLAATLRFNFGGTTAIESVVNGIDANAAIYDLSGRRVEKAVKGIYIQNGKKIIVK